MLIEKAIISKYTSYFHDGSLMDIQHEKGLPSLILLMESAEVDPSDIADIIQLSKEDRIKGKLHLKGVTQIRTDGNKTDFSDFKMNYDDAEIMHFKITGLGIVLKISWKNFPPKERTADFSVIEIDAKELYWENEPQ